MEVGRLERRCEIMEMIAMAFHSKSTCLISHFKIKSQLKKEIQQKNVKSVMNADAIMEER